MNYASNPTDQAPAQPAPASFADTASARWAADQTRPDAAERAAAEHQAGLDRDLRWKLGQRFGSDQDVGLALEKARYSARELGFTDEQLDAIGHGELVDQVAFGAAMADGLRMTASLTPAEARSEVERIKRHPGFLDAMDRDPRLLDYWRGCVARAGKE